MMRHRNVARPSDNEKLRERIGVDIEYPLYVMTTVENKYYDRVQLVVYSDWIFNNFGIVFVVNNPEFMLLESVKRYVDNSSVEAIQILSRMCYIFIQISNKDILNFVRYAK